MVHGCGGRARFESAASESACRFLPTHGGANTMLETKELPAFLKHVDTMDLVAPDVLVISGTDVDVAESIVAGLRVRLHKDIGAFESTIISGETDTHRLEQDIFNIPLFAPYRLILVRQGEAVFESAGKGAAAKRLAEQFKSLPDRTLIVVQYSGKLPAGVSKIFGARLAQLITRELLPGHVIETIRHQSKKHKLVLSDDALHEIRDRIQPRSGAIDLALARIKEALPAEANGHVSGEHAREILFPMAGMNHFDFVDALFRGDGRSLEREFCRFDKTADNVFGLLKLILNRTDEIRRAQSGRSLGMNDDELIQFLGLKSRPPFVQKKILSRLSTETSRFGPERLLKIYDWLVEMQGEFRSIVSGPDRQLLILQERVAEIFL